RPHLHGTTADSEQVANAVETDSASGEMRHLGRGRQLWSAQQLHEARLGRMGARREQSARYPNRVNGNPVDAPTVVLDDDLAVACQLRQPDTNRRVRALTATDSRGFVLDAMRHGVSKDVHDRRVHALRDFGANVGVTDADLDAYSLSRRPGQFHRGHR